MDAKEQAQHSAQYSETTMGITVTVVPEFVAGESKPSEGVYVFAYHVTLDNRSGKTVQLINRHWVVFSGGAQIADVKGEGVVGLQPVLEKDSGFNYSSFTVISDPIGAMFGTYTFRNDVGQFFDVKIPKFDLVHMDQEVIH